MMSILILLVRPAWAITWRWKSAVGLVVGTTSRTARVSIVRWNLKEAVGKISVWWTKTR